MNIFKKLRLRRSIQTNSNDTLVSTRYCLYVNNDDVREFDSEDELQSYIRSYMKQNNVFNVSVYKVKLFKSF